MINKKKAPVEEEKVRTVEDELRLALWFIGKIGDPLRARQVLNAAVSAMGVAAKPLAKLTKIK